MSPVSVLIRFKRAWPRDKLSADRSLKEASFPRSIPRSDLASPSPSLSQRRSADASGTVREGNLTYSRLRSDEIKSDRIRTEICVIPSARSIGEIRREQLHEELRSSAAKLWSRRRNTARVDNYSGLICEELFTSCTSLRYSPIVIVR